MPRVLAVCLPDPSSLQDAVHWEGWGTSLACKAVRRPQVSFAQHELSQQKGVLTPNCCVLHAGWAHAGEQWCCQATSNMNSVKVSAFAFAFKFAVLQCLLHKPCQSSAHHNNRKFKRNCAHKLHLLHSLHQLHLLLSLFLTAGNDQALLQQLCTLLFSRDASQGLGMNIVRYNIGGADPAAAAEYRTGAAVPCLRRPEGSYDW